MSDKKLSIRMFKMKSNKSTKSGNRFFKSYKQQMKHDFRIEDIEKDYLKRPNEKNKYYTFETKNHKGKELKDIENKWKKIEEYHKKKNGRKLHSQTKPTINFLLSFSKDFDLKEEDRIKQMEIVKKYILENYSIPIYLVQHNDEKSLHYTFSIFNYDLKNYRPLAKQIDTSKLQDNISNYLKKYGVDYGHSRGIKKTISLKEHNTILEGKKLEKEKELEDLKQQHKKELVIINNNKIELQKENDKLKQINLKYLGELDNYDKELKSKVLEMESILEDFIDLGLIYKNKSNSDLIQLFQRYLKKNETHDKVIKLQNKIEMIIKKSKDKNKGNNLKR